MTTVGLMGGMSRGSTVPGYRQINKVMAQRLGGLISAASIVRDRFVRAELVQQGAQTFILGCTDLSLLVDSGDASVPRFDTTRSHAQHAANQALDT